jgi:hypothetical protein
MIRKLGVGALVLGIATACGDSTGPSDEFDPVQTDQAADAVFDVIAQNQALQSIAILSQGFNFSAAQSAVGLATTATVEASGLTALHLQRLGAAAVSFSAAAPAALFPPSVVGITFVYNTQTSEYEADTTRIGAPAAGVRFILYAVDPILFRVVTPLQEIGYVDLDDESSPTANRVRITAVVGSVTALNYVATGSLGNGGANFSADGFISDGDNQVDFELDVGISASDITLDYLIALAGHNQSIRLVATGDLETDPSITVTITDGADSVVFTASTANGTIEGSISFNGEPVVLISGDEDDATFTRADGTPLTNAELAALESLGDIIGELFDTFDDLLAPAVFVFDFGFAD